MKYFIVLALVSSYFYMSEAILPGLELGSQISVCQRFNVGIIGSLLSPLLEIVLTLIWSVVNFLRLPIYLLCGILNYAFSIGLDVSAIIETIPAEVIAQISLESTGTCAIIQRGMVVNTVWDLSPIISLLSVFDRNYVVCALVQIIIRSI
ncbi:hypothetical protein ACFFRR_007127 [Megaselia abdita]